MLDPDSEPECFVVPVPFLRFRFGFTNTWAVGLGEPQQLRSSCRLLIAPQLQGKLRHQTVSTVPSRVSFVWYIHGFPLFGTFKGLLCLVPSRVSFVWYLQGSPFFGTLKGLLCLVPSRVSFVWYLRGSPLFGTFKGRLCLVSSRVSFVWYLQRSPLFGTFKGLLCLVPSRVRNFFTVSYLFSHF
jgi:hypothetical protein